MIRLMLYKDVSELTDFEQNHVCSITFEDFNACTSIKPFIALWWDASCMAW